MTTAMVAIEGVLGNSPSFQVNMQTDEVGRRLHAALSSWYRVVLVTSETDTTKVSYWLAMQGFTEVDDLLVNTTDHIHPAKVRAHQLRALRARRTPVTLVVDGEPEFVAHAMAQGVVGLFYGTARRAHIREDLAPQPIRSWGAILDEIAVQRSP